MPELESPILNNIVKNDTGEYKGGAYAPAPDPALSEGDVMLVQFYIKKKGSSTPELQGQIQSDPLDAPSSGKAWQWFSRNWISEA